MLSWEILLDVLVLLGAALVFGTIAEQLRQSAILGYLVAGTLVGPNVLGLVSPGEHVRVIAELGVALLLFTIGLEFSFRRLRRLGRVALVGGTCQVAATVLVGAAMAAVFGLGLRAALALGAMVALSSTACVLRLLVDRAELDSVHGRNALGILLLQDIAVIPLLLLVATAAAGGTIGEAGTVIGRTAILAALLVCGFVLLLNVVVPRLLRLRRWVSNRELPVLLAIVLALGSAYAAHRVSLSPAIGAFIAGVLLGGSPFAAQIRADVGSLRTLLVTLFFSSIGMLGDPAWVLEHSGLVGAVVLLIVVGKLVVVWIVIRLLGYPHGIAVATGLCIAQVGEFSFVLAETARAPVPLIDEDVFSLMISATIATLFLTPYLVAAAPRAALLVSARRLPEKRRERAEGEEGLGLEAPGGILIIGFGPAGQAVAGALYGQHRARIAVVELSTRTAAVARQLGLPVSMGDATQRDVLEHAGVRRASVVAVTVPDPTVVRTIIHVCRHLAPDAAIVARSRYHVRRWELVLAGAREVVDEEEHVGLRIAALARKHLPAEDVDEPTAEGRRPAADS